LIQTFIDVYYDTVENPGVRPLPRKTFLDVYYGYIHYVKKPLRLLLETTSVLLDSLDGTLENTGVRPLSRNPGVRPLPREVEI
jgi:hypothetical protein